MLHSIYTVFIPSRWSFGWVVGVVLGGVTLLMIVFTLPLKTVTRTGFTRVGSRRMVAIVPRFAGTRTSLSTVSGGCRSRVRHAGRRFRGGCRRCLIRRSSLPGGVTREHRGRLGSVTRHRRRFRRRTCRDVRGTRRSTVTPVCGGLSRTVRTINGARNIICVFSLTHAPVPFMKTRDISMATGIGARLNVGW